MSYENYEVDEKIFRKENNKLLAKFRLWLSKSGLKEKTIRKHSQTIEFYINDYLLYSECIPAKDGISAVSGYFNSFFPRKAMWSNKSSTKANVASLKKFYKFLAEVGEIDIVEYHILLNTIKEEMHEWLSHYSNEYEWE